MSVGAIYSTKSTQSLTQWNDLAVNYLLTTIKCTENSSCTPMAMEVIGLSIAKNCRL